MNELITKNKIDSCKDLQNKQLEIGQICLVYTSWLGLIKCRLVGHTPAKIRFEILLQENNYQIGKEINKFKYLSKKDVFILEDSKD